MMVSSLLRHLSTPILVSFLLSTAFLSASGPDSSLVVLPEITELNYDLTERLEWQPSAFTDWNHPYALEGRIFYRPDLNYAASRLLLFPGKRAKADNAYIKLLGYHKLRQQDKPYQVGRAGLYSQSSGVIRSFAIGSFTLSAGEGLCLAIEDRNKSGSGQTILPVSALSHPSFTGAAFTAGYRQTTVTAWLSATNRLALLDDNRISHLYISDLVDPAGKDIVQETSSGFILNSDLLSEKHRLARLGGFFYQQSFVHYFSTNSYDRKRQISAIFGLLRHKALELGFETDLEADKPAWAVQSGYNSELLKQILRYYNRPAVLYPSYSQTRQIFGQQTGCEEISWDSICEITKEVDLTVRIAAVKYFADSSSTRWKERAILAIKAHKPSWQAGLNYYRFRKDLIAAYDSLEEAVLPTQNRFKAFWKQEFSQALSYSMSCQYQHYLDRKFTKNGFALQHSFAYKGKKADCNLAFITWTNQKTAYTSTDLLTDDELLLQADSDSALRFHISYHFVPSFKVSASIYRPFRDIATQAYSLNLQITL